ncbi:MAG TPA: CBS domain-containing protein [Vicinamibacterales bacterium]|jgi:CBS domain-containing protein|nr:CBS domain-containing protein [Vicinamibacterales bacterium]
MKPISAVIQGQDTAVVPRTASVVDAVRIMTARNIGAVPVVDDERLVGIFTERDVMARVVAVGLDPKNTEVGDVMSPDLVTADVRDTCDTCLRRLQQARVRHLIVLNEGRLAGVLSLRDLLAVDADEKDEAINLLNAYVHYIPADLARKA